MGPTEGGARIPRARRLELRRRSVSAHGVETLNVDLRDAAEDRRIVRYILQTDCGRPVHAEVGRLGEVVAARVAEPKVADEGRRKRPGQSERQPLRTIEVRPEFVVERPFGQTG